MPAQMRTPNPGLLDSLVFQPYLGSDFANAYPPNVKAQIDKYVQRYNSYRSKRPRRDDSGSEKMVHDAWVLYETRLVAFSDDPRGPALAAAYVDRLKPCYEWEGLPRLS